MDAKLKVAIKTIMDECREHESCNLCPFYLYNEHDLRHTCKLATSRIPEHWDILPADEPVASPLRSYDAVNHPSHYCKNGLECIDVIKSELTPEQYKGYLYGNVLKYMWRWQDKNGLEDLKKAAHYLEWLQEEAGK